LVLDGLVVTDFLRENEILSIIGSNTNEVVLSPSNIEYSRPELISCFKFLNNKLRTEGLRAGIDRFSEFANILFLKLLAEKGKSSIWEELKTLDADHLVSFLNQAVNEKLAREDLPKDILTPTAIRNSNVLKKIIKELDGIQLVDIDIDVKGTAFEYFLKQSSSSENDLGEYFTPRHVVKAIVDLVSPRFTEKIYDPFCGTGGFLIEASKRIKQNTKNLTSEQMKIFCNETIFGSEITNTARIAKMNLVLHDICCDGIRQVDSLEHPVENEYDVVLTNIPFSQKTTHEQLYFDGVAQHGDSVCILHCLKALKTKGRMAIIVPDGFLFRKDQQDTRAFLIEHSNLEYIISLPRGTFLPYTATKTHILYFTNAHKPEMRQFFWYFDIKENVSTVDSKKEQSKALDVIKTIQEVNFRDLENESPAGLFKKGFKQISLANLRENNYNLRRVFFSDEPLKKEHIFLKEIVQLTKGKPPSKTSRTKTEGCLPYLNLNSLKNNGIVYIPGPDIEGLVVCNKEDILVVADGNVGFVFFGNFGVVASTFFFAYVSQNQRL
jgi:type I restriction enzyme M protein